MAKAPRSSAQVGTMKSHPPAGSKRVRKRQSLANLIRIASLLVLLALLVTFTMGLSVSFYNTITPAGIVIHHTAEVPGPVDLKRLDDFHRERGFGAFYYGRRYHVAYHYVILPDGAVEAGRPERCRGAHAREHNDYLGVALVGYFSNSHLSDPQTPPHSPTAAQLWSLASLCRRLQQRYEIPADRVFVHSQLARTECPGDRFPFGWLTAELNAPAPDPLPAWIAYTCRLQ